MAYAIEMRKKLAQLVFGVGLSLSVWAMLSDSAYGLFVGLGLLAVGIVMLTSVATINGGSFLLRLMSRPAMPKWHGGVLFTDGGEHKVRYDFDRKGAPWFVAEDVCVAVGRPQPRKGDLRCGGAPLLVYGKHLGFSAEGVQVYLMPLAIRNHDATRLLVNIRNNVLRKVRPGYECNANRDA